MEPLGPTTLLWKTIVQPHYNARLCWCACLATIIAINHSIKGRFTPWTMKLDHKRWPLFNQATF